MNFAKLRLAYRAYRSGVPLGDVVVLKLDALHSPPVEVTRRLRALSDGDAAPDLGALRRLADGTLGREYARFLDDNGIAPLVVSPALRERFRDDPYALRYTRTHDVHHVLAGFDTGLAGEAGVLAFNVGQNAAPIGRAMLWFVRVFYALVSPSQWRAVGNNVRVGLAMGRAAKLVIAEPLERWYGEPLAAVRAKLAIPDPARAGARKSGTSVVADLILHGA
jgi:ubiquinone biosynthesis protein COQ4